MTSPSEPPAASSSTPSLSIISRATAAFRRAAAQSEAAHGPTTTTADVVEAAYTTEITRINSALAAERAMKKTAGGHGAVGYLPPLYLRARDPVAEGALRLLRDTSKSFELNLRFREIEKLDRMHAKLWELLSEQNRSFVTAAEYKDVMARFQAWARDEFSAADPTVDGDDAVLGQGTTSSSQSHRSSHDGALLQPQGDNPLTHSGEGVVAGSSSAREASPAIRRSDGAPSYASSSSPSLPSPRTGRARRRPNASESLQRPVDDATPLGNVLFLPIVRPPRPTMELFLSCPRSTVAPDAVDIKVLYQVFGKKVSLVKCEAELVMWDTNGDGRLSEDEMESYVRDLVSRMAALRNMSEEVLPFYCCTASRRLFWDLDPCNRGVVRIDALLQSAVMDEWVSLQLLTEDNPRNWFGLMATQQLYEKFLLLDTRNEGTLNAENLRRYKKGLPTVIDDGLPLDVSPLCTLFIDRFFETNVMMAKSEMDYRKFVDFVIAVEMLPQCSRPTFLWNILDLRGDGVVTAMTANYFFRETHAKLVSAGLDVPTRETVIQEVFDLIPTAEPLRITREEFIASPQAGLFVALLVDCLSFWAYENREQR